MPGGAHAPLGRCQPKRGAVRRRRHPAVDGGDASAGREEVPGDQVVDGAVGKDRQDEGRAQGGRPAQGPPPAAAEREHVDHRGQQQRLAHLGEDDRGAQHQATGQDRPPARGRPPQQDGQAGHDQRLEPDVRHEHLLDLDLVGVEQQRRRGQRGQPARAAAAQQQQVDDHGHGQAKQMLDGGDGVEVGDREDRPQRPLVADRVHAGRVVVQVPGRVDVEQHRPVGDLGEHPEHQPRGQQRGGQPVPPQQRPGQAGAGLRRPGRAGPALHGCGFYLAVFKHDSCRAVVISGSPASPGRRWNGTGQGRP